MTSIKIGLGDDSGWSSDTALQKKGYQVVYVDKPAWVVVGANGPIIFQIEVNKATEE